jgi:DoxX-like family
MNVALWIVQGLLAAVFLLAGGAKLVLPLDQMTGPVALPGWFLRFIGLAEVLGALGLVLPGLLRIRAGLLAGRGGVGHHHDRSDGRHVVQRHGRGGADERDRGAPRCVRHIRPLGASAVPRLIPPVGAPAHLESTQ